MHSKFNQEDQIWKPMTLKAKTSAIATYVLFKEQVQNLIQFKE